MFVLTLLTVFKMTTTEVKTSVLVLAWEAELKLSNILLTENV